MKRAKKIALINVQDYPYECYSAYWEIRVDPETFEWGVRIYDYATSKVIDEKVGGAETKDEADEFAQSWVMNEMTKYRRDEPLVKMTEARILELVARFDVAREEKKYGTCDHLRGMLKAYGIKLHEGKSIDYKGPTKWGKA